MVAAKVPSPTNLKYCDSWTITRRPIMDLNWMHTVCV